MGRLTDGLDDALRVNLTSKDDLNTMQVTTRCMYMHVAHYVRIHAYVGVIKVSVCVCSAHVCNT